MKKYLIAAGVTSLLIAAQAMASDAASLVGPPETAVAPAETASAPAATARAYSNAPARPLMVAGEAGALSASTVAVPVVAEVTAPVAMTAVSRVPDRVGPAANSYNAMLSASSQTGNCYIEKWELGGRTNGERVIEGVTRDQCLGKAEQIQRYLTNSGMVGASLVLAIATWAVVANDDDPESGT